MSDRELGEAMLRRALGVMGFEEVKDGIFVRLDAPSRRARTPGEARFVTTVRLAELVASRAALCALLRRFPRVNGAPVR
jgi:hypothetical protein